MLKITRTLFSISLQKLTFSSVDNCGSILGPLLLSSPFHGLLDPSCFLQKPMVETWEIAPLKNDLYFSTYGPFEVCNFSDL